jgi:3-hydroxyacyl-CoA dehydrogenase/3-hydroxy-2-methylbutyryl-CoA dehydrogenase
MFNFRSPASFDLNEEAGNAAVAELCEDKALLSITDVTSEESVAATIDATMKKFGAIHVNINCPGLFLTAIALIRCQPATPSLSLPLCR